VKPYKISHLSLGFIILVAVMAVALSAYTLHELDSITQSIKSREQQVAVDEIREAMTALGEHTAAIGKHLAEWEETRQQLVVAEYYGLWRDARVRDAGVVPDSTDTLAIYDKSGQILKPAPPANPMPATLPRDAPYRFIVSNADADVHNETHLLYFHPIFADPGKTHFMGHVAIKLDLLNELHSIRQFRFADIQGIDLSEIKRLVSDPADLTSQVRFNLKSNPTIDFIREIFKTELLRMLLFVIAILSLASFLLHRMMVRPLLAISREIDNLHNNPDLDSELMNSGRMPVQELEHVRNSFSNYRNRLSKLHQDLENSSRSFYEQARRDALTGAFNRRALEEDWEQAGIQHDGLDCALILFDCDHFKAINDTYGHDIGDAVIRAVSDCLERALRSGDHLYRLGGDEFATILPAATERQVHAIAERCLELLQEHDFGQYGLPEPVSISIGIAMSHDCKQPFNLSELQKRADLAMYSAKRPESNKIVFYQEGLGTVEALVANSAISAVYAAIKDPGLISMRYQAIMHLPEQQPDYVEALSGIRNSGQYFSPADIFPIIQSRRLDAEYDLAVIKAIRADIAKGSLGQNQGVSINVSAPGIVHAKVIEALIALCRDEAPRKIVIEITETALITQMETATAHIHQLRAVGCLLALDDFGSGYSSLRYLSSMPVDIVKFDISMIRLLEDPQPKQQRITVDVADIVKKAGYAIVAEGVESENLLSLVTGLGFDFAQGFYFGKP
jgi:diguanylate cyclase (GGDEF)-like protein